MKAELDIYKTVKKSNILNELRNANASLVEYRLFCVYLAHLPMNSEDNVVTFSLADYARIAGLGRPRYEDLEAQSKELIKLSAMIRNPDGGFSNRPLFADFTLFREDDQWMVSMECSQKIAPMIREQKGRFLRYKLYNTIYLKSYNQQRMYELLKQYEKIGVRTEDLTDLRAYLSVGENEYSIWGDFSQKVLKVAQKALKENTDICFEYEPVKKGRKVVAVRFEISKNIDFKDPMEMDKFLPEVADAEYEGTEFSVRADEDEPEKQIEQLTIDTQESPAEPELIRENQDAKEFIKILRTFMKDGYEYTDDELNEIVLAVQKSAWWQESRSSWFGILHADIERQAAFRDYAESQYSYCVPRTKSKTKRGFLTYVVRAARENFTKFPVRERKNPGSFDTDDFFEAALKRSDEFSKEN